MKIIPIAGAGSKTENISDNNQPESLILTGVSETATITADLIRENKIGQKLLNKVSVPFLAEFQNKLEFLVGGKMKVLSYSINENSTTLDNAVIDLGVNGEIALANNDIYKLFLATLGARADATAVVMGGTRLADAVFTLTESKYKEDDDVKEVDLSTVSFIAFDPNSMPSNIEFISKEGQRIDYTAKILKSYQKDVFGVVAYERTTELNNSLPVFGFRDAVVLDVRQAQSVYLKDENEERTDITFYTV